MDKLYIFHPIGILPMPLPILPLKLIEPIAMCLFTMLLSLGVGYLLNNYTKGKWKIESLFNLLVPVIVSGLIYLRFGLGMTLIKGIILLFILLFASNSDIKNREVTNFAAIALFITALIGINISSIPLMLISAFFLTIPQLLIAVLNPGSYGGADIKIMFTSCFLLGFEKGLIAIVLGLLTAILTTVIIRKIKKEDLKKSIPLIPYLGAGVMLAFLV